MNGATTFFEFIILTRSVHVNIILRHRYINMLRVILQIARKEDSATSELGALVRPGMILKWIFLNTYYLQPLSSSYGKRVLEKIEETLEIFCFLEALAYFSSTLHKMHILIQFDLWGPSRQFNLVLKCSQYRNGTIQLKNFLILKLPPFSVTYTVEERGGNFKPLKFFNWKASFLYWLCFKKFHDSGV